MIALSQIVDNLDQIFAWHVGGMGAVFKNLVDGGNGELAGLIIIVVDENNGVEGNRAFKAQFQVSRTMVFVY